MSSLYAALPKAHVTLRSRCNLYCPNCRAEYREGFAECSDCQVPLSPGSPPPTPPSQFDPDLDLVVILETDDRVQLALAMGLLRDTGIPFYVLGQIATLIQDVDPFLHKWVRLQVPRDRETEARELMQELLQPETSPSGDTEKEDENR